MATGPQGNLLGLSGREARLADRVRDAEAEVKRLRKFLGDKGDGSAEEDPCENKVRILSWHFSQNIYQGS